jgi:4-diphosphocytidyl-2C-methyl-D-erythritol kinase
LEGAAALGFLKNDLETAALEEAPDLAEKVGRIRGVLVREGAQLAALSGSGGTYFGLFGDAPTARRARASLTAGGFRAIYTRTVPLERYLRIWSSSSSQARGGRAR